MAIPLLAAGAAKAAAAATAAKTGAAIAAKTAAATAAKTAAAAAAKTAGTAAAKTAATTAAKTGAATAAKTGATTAAKGLTSKTAAGTATKGKLSIGMLQDPKVNLYPGASSKFKSFINKAGKYLESAGSQAKDIKFSDPTKSDIQVPSVNVNNPNAIYSDQIDRLKYLQG